ncbi:ribosome modulation factor [Oceaniserpentilla sp. 4NH20-0058]|uniref:ribosome modulation factor n=1 Tax=Oceaniserpentilla sp. 4NH20-0058 TaxID=3127660 RepID=UPI00334021CE
MKLVDPQWDVENLEKAYRRGFMAGMVGKEISTCPHKTELVINAWEAGWCDGKEQFDIKYPASFKKTV